MIAMIVTIGIGWGVDYESCLRSAYTRKVNYQLNRIAAQTNWQFFTHDHGEARTKDFAAYQRAENAATQLEAFVNPGLCLAPLPPTH